MRNDSNLAQCFLNYHGGGNWQLLLSSRFAGFLNSSLFVGRNCLNLLGSFGHVALLTFVGAAFLPFDLGDTQTFAHHHIYIDSKKNRHLLAMPHMFRSPCHSSKPQIISSNKMFNCMEFNEIMKPILCISDK